jgi:hypothetical protein
MSPMDSTLSAIGAQLFLYLENPPVFCIIHVAVPSMKNAQVVNELNIAFYQRHYKLKLLC